MSTSRRFSFGIKSLAVLLSVLTVLLSLPLTVFSFDIGDGGTSPEHDASISDSDIIEVMENRTADEKTFRLTNGSFYTAHYDTDIHEEDENGRFTDIDNRLYRNGSVISTSNGRYSFPHKTSDDSSLFTLTGKESSLSFSLVSAEKDIKGEIKNNKTEFDKDADPLEVLTTLDNIRSSVRYENILPGTDIEYVLYGKNVKEKIIVKGRDSESDYTYTFTLSLEGLVPDFGENGQLDLVDPETGDTAYFLPAPAMWDASDEFSDAVSYDISSGGNGTYILTVTADAGWINDESRAFPVTIDPPVYSNTSNVIDLDLPTNLPNYSSPNDQGIFVSNTLRAYWKLTTLPSLPQSAYITKAEISLRCFSNEELHGYVGVYDVLSDWTSSLTWAAVLNGTAGVPASTFTDYRLVETIDPDGFGILYPYYSWYTWNVTSIVKKWYEGENYGMMFQPAGGTFTGTAKFRSNNYNDQTERPSLCITYSDMKGLEDYWSFASQDAGIAGQAYINNATGNLVVSIPTLTTTDALMPVSPALVYNHCMYFGDYKYPTAQTANTSTYMPKSFKLNINETLIRKQYTDSVGDTKYCIIWADGDGTEHYFFPKPGSSNVYEDEDGLHLTLTYSTASCTIKDSSDTVKTFTSRTKPNYSEITNAWYLSEITDKSGNKTIINVDSAKDYRPTSVSLKPYGVSSPIEQLRFAYTTGGKLFAVYNPTSGEGVVFRYSSTFSGAVGTSYGNYLRYVIRAHGVSNDSAWLAFYNTNGTSGTASVTVDAVASYDYNYLGIITKITNLQTGLSLEYNVFYSKKVSICKEYSTVLSSYGQKLDYTYTTAGTVLRTSGKDDILNNSDDLLTTITFDNYGRAISCYTTDVNKTQIYGASGGQFVGAENSKVKNSLKSSVETTQQSSNYLLNGGFEAQSAFQYWQTNGDVRVTSPIVTSLNYNAASLTVNSSTHSSSVYQAVDLDKGEYTLSANVFTYEMPAGVTACLKAESPDNSAHTVTKEIPCNLSCESGGYYPVSLTFASDPSVSGGKERFVVSVIVTGAPSSDGTVNIDDVMLSKTTGAAEYDLATAGHFDTTDSGNPLSQFWHYNNYPNTGVTVTDSGIAAFGNVIAINADFTDDRCVSQKIYQATDSMKEAYLYDDERYDSSPVSFKISGWAKGTGQSYSEGALFDITLTVHYFDGTSHPDSLSYGLELDRTCTDWQFVSGAILTDPSHGMIDYVEIGLNYRGHQGIGYFDGISVNINSETVSCYQYGSASGNLDSYTSGSRQTSFEYEDPDFPDKVTKVTDYGSKTITEYTYDTRGREKTQIHKKFSNNANNPQSLSRTIFNYDSYGLVTSVVVEDLADTTLKTRTATAYYTSDKPHLFGVVKSETDAKGKETKYFHNESNGRLTAVIYPDGKGTYYVYDGSGYLMEVLPAVYNTSTGNAVQDPGGADVKYDYNAATKRLSSITTYTDTSTSNPKYTTYTFTYDGFGKPLTAEIGTRTLTSCTYNSGNGKLNTLVYGNGLNVLYVYDVLDRISEIKHRNGSSDTSTTAFRYSYTATGLLYSVTDCLNGGETTVYEYDTAGKLVSSYKTSSAGNITYGSAVFYDEESRVDMVFDDFSYYSETVLCDESAYYSYSYNSSGNLSYARYKGTYIYETVTPVYDNLGRLKDRTVVYGINGSTSGTLYNHQHLEYEDGLNGYSYGQISKYTSTVKKSQNTPDLSVTEYKYTYDSNGNITEIRDADNVIQYRYVYNTFGRLIREDNYPLDQTFEYSYDKNGNITAKYVYDSFTTGQPDDPDDTIDYYYSDTTWRDLLTNYNGTQITYDALGNPVSIGGRTFTWRGKQLTGYSLSSTRNLSFSYNADGVRTQKTDANGSTTLRHEYTLRGSQIIKETVFENNTESYTLIYLYDENNLPVGIRLRDHTDAERAFLNFFFEKNLQGDVVAIWNQAGTKVVTYTYDAWGNVTVSGSGASGIGQKNPFRYRSYYYDTETGYYYLSTRYYNPVWGRFISADSTDVLTASETSLSDKNLFAYCDDNPVNRSDDGGEFWHILAGAAIGAIGGAISSIVSQAISGEDINWKAVGISAASGAISGAITAACPCMGPIATGLVQGSLSAATYAATEKIAYGRDPTVEDTLRVGITIGVMAGGMKFLAQEAGLVQCFVAGTLVSAKHGLLPIEDIQPGDLVWATDPDTGETALKTVVRTFRNESEELVHLTVSGEEIMPTPGHPFWVPQKGWTKAVHLRAGDRLQLLNGEYVVVEQVQHELLEDPVFVYNFEVEDFHTYYVGNESVLVHNIGCKNPEHGNSLKTSKPAQGYILKDRTTNEILKYGETTMGYHRYSDAYLTQNNAYMDFVKSGTKAAMHEWQHKMIEGYVAITGQLPPLNHSLW